MRPESSHITSESELIDSLLDAFAETLLSRELTSAEREELQSLALQRIEGIRDTARTTVHRQLSDKSVFTPPELAREWGVSPDKILGWIRSGELRATNVATTQTGRPRYRIDADAIEQFKLRRTNQSPPPVTRRKRRTPSDVIEFF